MQEEEIGKLLDPLISLYASEVIQQEPETRRLIINALSICDRVVENTLSKFKTAMGFGDEYEQMLRISLTCPATLFAPKPVENGAINRELKPVGEEQWILTRSSWSLKI